MSADHFKIVFILKEDGDSIRSEYLYVPYQWIDGDYVFLPLNQSLTLRKDPSSVPESSWKKFDCTIKMNYISGKEEAELLEKKLNALRTGETLTINRQSLSNNNNENKETVEKTNIDTRSDNIVESTSNIQTHAFAVNKDSPSSGSGSTPMGASAPLSDYSTPSSSKEDSDSEDDMCVINKFMQQMESKNKRTEKVDAFIKEKIKLVEQNGNLTEYALSKLFRWMLETNIYIQKLQKTVESLQINKTAENLVPGVRLPAEDPNELKKVDDFIKNTEGAFSQVVDYLLTKVSGKNAADRASSLMSSVMTFYCAAHFVWDGKHNATNPKLALAKTLPSLEKCLQEVITKAEVKDVSGKVVVSSKELKASITHFLTRAPKKHLKKDSRPIQKPWIYE